MSELKDDLRDLVLGVSIDLVVMRQYPCHGKYGFKFEAHCLILLYCSCASSSFSFLNLNFCIHVPE